jgi:hypothetical protein
MSQSGCNLGKGDGPFIYSGMETTEGIERKSPASLNYGKVRIIDLIDRNVRYSGSLYLTEGPWSLVGMNGTETSLWLAQAQ